MSQTTYLHHLADLLALQLHGSGPVADNADRFLEGDALQGSLSWRRVTDILGRPARFLHKRTNTKHRGGGRSERQREGAGKVMTVLPKSVIFHSVGTHAAPHTHFTHTHTHTRLHCSSRVNPLQQQGCVPTTRGHRIPAGADTTASFQFGLIKY